MSTQRDLASLEEIRRLLELGSDEALDARLRALGEHQATREIPSPSFDAVIDQEGPHG